METLEEQMAKVEAENKRLMQENQMLLQQTSVLTTENSQLKQQLGLLGDVEVKKEDGSPVESAVLNNVLPQQEQIRALCQLTTSCMAYLISLRCVSRTPNEKKRSLLAAVLCCSERGKKDICPRRQLALFVRSVN